LTKHNLDVRADSIAAEAPSRHGDDLLSTADTANWLGVSQQFLTIGRVRGYGPKFVRFGVAGRAHAPVKGRVRPRGQAPRSAA
jgi:hypothetical protein